MLGDWVEFVWFPQVCGYHLQLNWTQLPWQSILDHIFNWTQLPWQLILDPIFNWAEPNCLDNRSWIPSSNELNPTALTIDPGSHLQLNWTQLPWQSILDPIFNWAEPYCLDSRSWIPSSTELNPAALILHVNFKSLCTQVSLGTDTGCRKQEKHKLKKNWLKLRWMESWEA